jgi:phosphoglycerate dehydrogenase-like enzyme
LSLEHNTHVNGAVLSSRESEIRPIYRNIPSHETENVDQDVPCIRPHAVMLLDAVSLDLVYGPEHLADIEKLVDLIAPPQSRHSILNNPQLLAKAQVLITGWGGPVLDDEFLDAAPNLKAVFYGAGALGAIATPAAWDREIVMSSAYAINAIPVAEYSIAAILFSLKHGWRLSKNIQQSVSFRAPLDTPGCYGSTVGLVSMGMVARTLLKHLALCDLRVLAFDPYLDPAEANQLGVELVSLAELFRRSDVVSLHTPLFAETVGLVTGQHIASMKRGATLINTSRGKIVREEEMLDVLEKREDLQAVLDVCIQEPPNAKSRLLNLPNVVLTPHLAGSVGIECRRMGKFIVEELDRYVTGRPLQGLITPKLSERTSHRPERPRKRSALLTET